ncbi:MAG: MBOAT family protein [Urechidicola sp.]|nr:MBOAT family protein [Urechidicola sp.]
MLFNSFDFLFFFPLVVILYYVLAHKYRAYLLLIASYFFYFYWEPSLVLLLFASTVIDYYVGIKIHNTNNQKKRKLFLYFSILVNLGMLFYFKYLGFFAETSFAILDFFGIEHATETVSQTYNIKKILLPVGISFYTFQTMSYSIDVYRKLIKPERSFVKYALYVSFFPQLVAGPIERANRLIPQFYKKIEINIPAIKQGVIMMAWGFFLKLVVADRLGIYADAVFANPKNYGGPTLILGVYFFSFQLYYDFSAYTTIAIGAAKILGFNLMQNFNRPMVAKNMVSLWQRWHISLLKWLRDYMLIPLSKTKLSRYWIILIVFFSMGLWHGAGWNFIVWGLLNGVFLIFEVGTKKHRKYLINKINIPFLFPVFEFSWRIIWYHSLAFSLIFFRSPSFDIALEYLDNLFVFDNLQFNILKYSYEFYLTIGLLIFVQIIHYYKGNDKVYELITKRTQPLRWAMYILFIFGIVLFSINRQNNFIYFQF